MKKRKSWLERIQQSKGNADALALAKTYEFEMTYNDHAVKDRIDTLSLQHGLDPEAPYIPTWLGVAAYDCQDLIIACKCEHIKTPTYWEVAAQGIFLSQDGTKTDGVPFYIEIGEISLREMIYGSAKKKVNRGGGVKTRWKGINDEIVAHYKAEAKAGFVLQYTQVKMTAHAQFVNVHMMREFNLMIQKRDAGKLIEHLQKDPQIVALDKLKEQAVMERKQ